MYPNNKKYLTKPNVSRFDTLLQHAFDTKQISSDELRLWKPV